MKHAHIDSRNRLVIAFLLTASFMFVEVAGGLFSGSLALLADAGHMLTDAASLFLALIALRYSERKPDARRTFGYHRTTTLAAFLNALSLFVIVAFIVVEASKRLWHPSPVLSGTMLLVASIGLVVNIISFAILHGGDRHNLNMRGAALHVMGDLLGSLAAIIAALVIMLTGWTPIDPILSVVVSGLILRSAWALLRQAAHILMEGAPEHLVAEEVRLAIVERVPQALDVHHVHIWALSPERILMTMHVKTTELASNCKTLKAINDVLRERFGVDHATIQLEQDYCTDSEPPLEIQSDFAHDHGH